MKKIFYILILLSFSKQFLGQTSDTLNKYNTKHNKQGFWKVYLTDYLIETADTSKAYYYAYNYYINGHLVIWTSQPVRKVLKIVSDVEKPFMGRPILLNGSFKFYDSNDCQGLGCEKNYKGGLTIYQVTYGYYYSCDPVKIEIADYTKQYQSQFGSFLYERYKLNGKLTYRRFYTTNKKGRNITRKVQ